VLWVIGIVVALLTTALLIVNLHPKIWKGLLEERNLTLMAIGVNLTAIIVLLAIGGATRRWTGFRGKTVWDWMDLLIVPLVLVVIGLGFTMLQDARQQDLENQRTEQAQKLENQRAEAEQDLAEQRAQDEALQAYLDQMSSLILDKDRPLHQTQEGDAVRILARARTLTILTRLDPSRKTAVMQFLLEMNLIEGREGPTQPRPAKLVKPSDENPDGVIYGEKWSYPIFGIIRLAGADLSGIEMRWADLSYVSFSEADLSNAYLFRADLTGADLSNVNLSNAYLRKAELNNTMLNDADLSGANLVEADLRGSNVSNEQLRQVKTLKGATMPDGQFLKTSYNPDGPTLEEWLNR